MCGHCEFDYRSFQLLNGEEWCELPLSITRGFFVCGASIIRSVGLILEALNCLFM